MTPSQTTLSQCRSVLSEHYGNRLRKIILFGSVARGQGTAESDLDLLVVLDGPVDAAAEAKVLTDLLFPLQLESDRYISAKAAAADEYEAGAIQLYRNVLREGVPV